MTITKRRAWSGCAMAAFACLLAQGCSRGDFADLTTDAPSNVDPAPGTSFANDGGDGGEHEGGAVCATATVPISRTAIYMQIILDGSGSMNDPLVSGGPTGLKWKAAASALTSFFDDLAMKNDQAFAVGLFLFDGTKGVPEFAIADIAMHQVDANQKGALEMRLSQSTPQGGTPLGLALEGQLPLLQNFTAQAPLKANGKRVLLVITDGVPDGAADVQPQVQAHCIQLVQDAFAATPSITTFAVGVGDPASDTSTYDEVFMGKLAVAGGAPAPGCTPGWNQASPAGQVPCHF